MTSAATSSVPLTGRREWETVGHHRAAEPRNDHRHVSRSNISVALAVPDFAKAFHLSDTDRGTLDSAFFWAYAALQIPAGWVVDRYGVRIPYAISLVFWCLASAGTAMTNSLPQLTTLRVLLGAGEAIAAPASYRWIRYNFVEKERGLTVGLYMTGTKIGPAIGAPLAAWLIIVRDWRAMFVIFGLGGLVWVIPWLLLVKNDAQRPTKDVPAKDGAAAVPFRRIMASPVTWGTVIATFCYMYSVYFCMTCASGELRRRGARQHDRQQGVVWNRARTAAHRVRGLTMEPSRLGALFGDN